MEYDYLPNYSRSCILHVRSCILRATSCILMRHELHTTRQELQATTRVTQADFAFMQLAFSRQQGGEVSQPSTSQVSASSTIIPNLQGVAFGASQWNKYFGDVGVEPPLPANIKEILTSPCPFWPSKSVGETHLLVLIPKTVDGQPFTLNSLGKLIKSPKSGGYATKYRAYTTPVTTMCGKKSVSESYWVLMTRDILPGTGEQNIISRAVAFVRESGERRFTFGDGKRSPNSVGGCNVYVYGVCKNRR